MEIIVNIVLSGIIGAIIGALISAYISWMIFRKRNKIDRYLSFVDDFELVLNLYDQKQSEKEESKKEKVKHKINLLLNKSYSKAMVSMDSELFRKITKIISEGIDRKSRNRIYYLMRQDIYGRKSKVTFEEVMNKYIEIKKNQ